MAGGYCFNFGSSIGTWTRETHFSSTLHGRSQNTGGVFEKKDKSTLTAFANTAEPLDQNQIEEVDSQNWGYS